MDRKIETRQLVNIIVLFLIVQFGGIVIAILSPPPLQPVVPTSAAAAASFEDAFFYLAYVVVMAVLIILIFKFYRGKMLFALLEGFVVLFATGYVIFSVLGILAPSFNPYYLLGIAGVATLLLIVAKNITPRLRNFIAITSSMGVGILIGFNGFFLSYLLMMLIAVYDYIAVFVTKHMITMAKEVSSRNLAFLIGSSDVEAVPGAYLTEKELKEFRKNAKAQKIKDPVLKKLLKEGIVPLVSQVQLGSGDLALPLMVAVSAYISFVSYSAALTVIIGSSMGMIFTMYLLKRYKVALPAIPPLFSFISFSLAAYFAIINLDDFVVWLPFLLIGLVTLLVLLRKLSNMDGKP